MRRRRDTNASDTAIVGAPTGHGGPTLPLPPPSAAATRAEVTALSEQVRELRDHLDGIVRGLTERVEAQLTTVRADHERVQAHIDERVAQLAVEHEVTLSQLAGRLDQQVEAMRTDQQAATQTLAQHMEQALQQLAGQMNSHAERTRAAADDESRRVQDQITHVQNEMRLGLEEIAAHQEAQLTSLSAAIDVLRAQLDTTAQQTAATEMTVMQLKDRVGQIDLDALDAMREKLTSLAGETALVRIEMDRLTGSIDDRFDRIHMRLSEVEAKADSDADVSLAVQLERLDELERAVAEIDPDQFVTRDEWERRPGGAADDRRANPGMHDMTSYAVGGQ